MSLRVLFFGTSEFAVPTLVALQRSRHQLVGVVTQPDRPRGRGLRLEPSPVKVAVSGAPVYQPEKVRDRDFIEQAKGIAPDAVVLAAFGQIIPRRLLDIPPKGPINVHASLLPKYRGAAPAQWALIAGETETGVTTMWMDEKLDTGDILLQRSMAIFDEDNAQTLTQRLAHIGADLLIETLDLLERGDCPRTMQNHGAATYAPAIKPEDGFLDWEWGAQTIVNRIRGVTPRPGAFTLLNSRRLKIWGAEVSDAAFVGADPGTIIAIERHGLIVAVFGGAVRLQEVQPESGKRMSAGDWAHGARVRIGDRFQKISGE